jgi:CheY-like chemotaxis protein
MPRVRSSKFSGAWVSRIDHEEAIQVGDGRKQPSKASRVAPNLMTEQQKISFPVVGIRASAGGLEALSELLTALTLETRMVWVAVQQLPSGDKIFLIALTGYGREQDRKAALGAGFECHLVKPITPQQIEELLAGTLSRNKLASITRDGGPRPDAATRDGGPTSAPVTSERATPADKAPLKIAPANRLGGPRPLFSRRRIQRASIC